MVAIICKDESSVADIFFKIVPFLSIELNKFMSTDVTEGALEYIITAEGNYIFICIHTYCGVLHQGIQKVGWHTLIRIPISRFVLQSCKKESIPGFHSFSKTLPI